MRKLQYESSVNPSIYEHSNIKNMIIDNKARMVGGLLFRDRIRYDLEEFNKLTPYNSYNTALDYDSVVQPIEKINLQVIKTFKCTDEYSYGYGKYICGVLKNNTTSAYYNINLIFDLIDSQGNIVDETSTSLKKMAPNATWNFKAIILDENITSWQLSNIEYNNSYNLNN